MHSTLQAAFAAEIRAAELAMTRDDLGAAFAHLERAHVLGQWHVVPHVRAHLGMLRIGWRRRDAREVLGQLLRIPGAVIGTAIGRVPRGNTGGANVSAFRVMPIPAELHAVLQSDHRSSRHLGDD
jgi:hypothetical protein